MVRPAFALTCAALALYSTLAAGAGPSPIGPQTHRIIVGFRTTPSNAIVRTISPRTGGAGRQILQAQTSTADVTSLAQRVGLALTTSRQITASMHVMFLQATLYGAHVQAALQALRADPAVSVAEIDERRYPLGAQSPNDPLFVPTPGIASGQWYMLAPNPSVTTEGVTTQDLAATDATDAWGITTGSSNIVIADVDTGVLFDHPDLLRANGGGRLLPGYDFVGEDYNPDSPYAALGTYLIANDGDGWDPDPSDPGDWISTSDVKNTLFPTSSCGDPSQYAGGTIPSSWHGTRVVGIFGAITDNDVGIAGMTWGNASLPGPWVLPVRALGKCGGYDSDIIAGIEWAAGLPVTPPNAAASSTPTIPANPFPADIINLSIGAPGSCGQDYLTALGEVTQLGILVVVSAGNGGAPGALAPVESPANCSAQVPGVIAVAGLRNVGTKVGYSSFGPEVGVSAPAGNCVTTGGNCLRSVDSTTNDGVTSPDPAGYTYTNEQHPDYGTSFSAPIVSGIAALMRSVNANLTPAQLVARLESSVAAFPPNNAVPALAICPSTDPVTGDCSCPSPGPGVTPQCGTGMVNALGAVRAALAPIGVIPRPAQPFGTSVLLDASGSVASCGNTVATYAWSASPASLIVGAANSAEVTIAPGSIAPGGTGTVKLTLTDSAGNVDTETLVLSATSLASSSAAATAGSAATACPAALAADPAAPAAPTISAGFAPANVATNASSTLTISIDNTNAFDLTQATFSVAVPAGLAIPPTSKAGTDCFGTFATLRVTSTTVSLTNAIVPAQGSCVITVPLQAGSAGAYSLLVPAGALTTGPAGRNTAAAGVASLSVSAPSGGGGGGQIEWPDLLLGASALLLIRGGRGRWKK
jgi:serine protease